MQHQRRITEVKKVSFPGLRTVPVLPTGKPLLTADMQASANKFRAEADLADEIARSATDPDKSNVYEGLANHFRQLADEIEAGRTI